MKKILFILVLLPLLVKAQNGIITTIAGNGTNLSYGDNIQAISAEISVVGLGRCDKQGNYYFSEGVSNKVRKINALGIITTIAGSGAQGFDGDSGLAINAKLHFPCGLDIDSAGNIYIADRNNYRIRKVDASTGIITTIAGNGIMAYSGDSGLAINASFKSPTGLCIDPSGNIYVGDHVSGTIRKINSSGIITTYAGSTTAMPNTGDWGPATLAGIPAIEGICSDKQGNIYITTANIRKVDAITGIISPAAGKYTSGPIGDSGPADSAVFNLPIDVAVDINGNIYIADANNNRIRKVNIATGIINTIVGNGIQGYGGDNGLPDSAELYLPEGVSLDTCGNLYIDDLNNFRIRKVTFNSSCPDTITSVNNLMTNSSIHICPNPINDVMHINNVATSTQYAISNILGVLMLQGTLNKGSNSINVGDLAPGMYVLCLSSREQRVLRKVVISR